MEWIRKPLSEVLFIQEGPGIRKYEYEVGGYPMINVRCVQDGYIDMSKSKSANYELATDKWKHFQVNEGDILYTISGTIGRSAIVKSSDLPLLMNTSVVRFRPLVTDLNSKYAYYYFKTKKFFNELIGYSTGTAIKNVGPSHLKKMEIEYPASVKEQKRIVAILDQAFADIDKARATAERNLKNARELFESTCENSIFTDYNTPNCTVLDVAKDERGSMRTGPFGSQLLKKEIVDKGIAVLGIDNAVNNEFKWGARRFITQEKFQELSRFEVKPKDVLITIMGTCGRCAIVPDDIPKAINTKHICCITLDQNRCLPEYLHIYFLYHPVARDYLLSRAKGAIMAGLNMGIIKELPLVLPSIEVQVKLTSQVLLLKKNIESLEAIYKNKITAFDELKKSILQKAFNGELTKSKGIAA
jgi:type I restriction enzyme S subunit